jgi:hypothetical protein
MESKQEPNGEGSLFSRVKRLSTPVKVAFIIFFAMVIVAIVVIPIAIIHGRNPDLSRNDKGNGDVDANKPTKEDKPKDKVIDPLVAEMSKKYKSLETLITNLEEVLKNNENVDRANISLINDLFKFFDETCQKPEVRESKICSSFTISIKPRFYHLEDSLKPFYDTGEYIIQDIDNNNKGENFDWNSHGNDEVFWDDD